MSSAAQKERAERLRRHLGGEPGGRLPFTLDIGAVPGLTEPVLRRFRRETGAEDPAEYFDFDFRTFSLKARFTGNPRDFHRDAPPETTFDEWGIGHWAGGAESTYEKMLSPLAGAESAQQVRDYPEPTIEEPDPRPIQAFQRRGYPVLGYAGSLYEWSWWLRGMEGFMADLVLDPELAEALLDKVAGYTRRLALASARAGLDVLCFYDDAGMQRGLQVSPELWRRFIKPRWQEILAAVRAEHPGVLFFLHSCGNIREIVPDIVEAGFDILHPVQPECMDLAEVRRSFGREIILCATISAQRLFPFGTPEEVRREVRRLKGLRGGEGSDGAAGPSGWRPLILCPSNRVQPETPWENILAFVEEARSE